MQLKLSKKKQIVSEKVREIELLKSKLHELSVNTVVHKFEEDPDN